MADKWILSKNVAFQYIFFEFLALSHFLSFQNSLSAALEKNYDKTITFLPGKYTVTDLVTLKIAWLKDVILEEKSFP